MAASSFTPGASGTEAYRGRRALRRTPRPLHHVCEMCGRYSLIADLGELARRFEFDGDWVAFDSAYNVAPTQDVLTVVGGETRRARLMRWGLIPHWARDPKIGARMINARAETVAEKPAFRDALRRRRCLVLADGFYEWQRDGAVKRPMRIVMRSGEPFAFAGLWSVWRDPDGNRVPSAPSSPPWRMTWSALYTTVCRWSCPGRWRSSGSTTASTTPPLSAAS